MTRMRWLLMVTCFISVHYTWAEGRQPNILVILADDMGYGDLGVTGSVHLRTPHLDSLVKSGVFCHQGYVCSPVCSPSRAGLFTGRDPRRFGYQANLNQGAAACDTRPELLGLPPGEHTLGDHLRSAGYATALIGKWHMGMGEAFHPLKRGFDYYCGMLTGSHTYFPKANQHRIERNGQPVQEFSNPYLTDFFTDEALSWLDQHQNKKQPWFLFLSYNAPHGPMEATDDDLALFEHIENPRRRTYAAMMYALDRSVGRLRQYLKVQGASQDTLIVFFSDNGGATNNASWNADLSGAKGCLREGGVRVPMVYSWPGVLPAGTGYEQPASSLDLLPTFMAAAHANPLPLREPMSHEDKSNFKKGVQHYGPYDGINLLPYLKGEQTAPPRKLFWRLQGQASVLQGTEKLIRLSHRPAQLFRPASDRGEAHDLSGLEPDTLQSLFEELSKWESMLPTVPLWGSSPHWMGQSAKIYDTYVPGSEPK